MGFLAPSLPDFDLEEWKAKSHHEKVKPLAQDWALNGFGTPYAVYLLYVVKLVGYVLGAAALIATTEGIGGVTDYRDWWTELVVYEKVVVWTIVYEILGLGCGSMPLTFRFLPPIGGFLYWLRPGTMRLAPWPTRVPLTAGTTRTVVDVLLYVAVLASGVVLLLADPVTSGDHAGLLPPLLILPLLGSLALLGLRDKAPFLAARPEQYAVILLVFLFPVANTIFALKLVMLAIWAGAATSKLNRHFPFVVSVMISNTPWQRSKTLKRLLWKDYPNDLRPSKLSSAAAHGGTVIEFTVPLVLLLSSGGLATTIALTIMVLFHIHITSTFPLGVPLEWNLFVIFSALFLFGNYADVGAGSFESPLLGVLLAVLLLGFPIVGNLRPHLLSFLPSMRYYAGNWATSTWLFKKDGTEQVVNGSVKKSAPLVINQLTTLYGPELAELLLYKGLAFRAMHSHGRALMGLLPRAVDDLEEYQVREGEFVAGALLGWNFGEGHLHDAQLLAAVQERCQFAPGQLRIITLESQPMLDPRQKYRILDAAEGLIEEGYVDVRDMVDRQPWLDEDDLTVPVEVLSARELPEQRVVRRERPSRRRTSSV
jgi:hypothetical protein